MDFKTGVICSLTNKKPEFHKKCNVIRLEERYKSSVIEVNIAYEALLKTRTDVYGHAIIFFIITFLIVIGGFLIGSYALDSGVISTVPLIIMGVGVITLGYAVGPLNNYRQRVKVALNNKKRIDAISRLYGNAYDINIEHHRDSLDNLSYTADLKLRKINNRDSL